MSPAVTSSSSGPLHVPVLLDEVRCALAVRDGAIYVDGTFGAGGYSAALLAEADCKVYAIDRDPAAIERGRSLAARYPERLELLEGRFGDLERLLTARGVAVVHGVVFDLGTSSPQLDEAARGFSFRFDGPLDMRMGSRGSDGGASAADLVNRLPEEELADIIWRYGEERHARRIARAIVAARAAAPIARTLELAAVVRKVVRKSPDGIDPATRTFQALRIQVNDEIGELRRGLAAAERLLAPGGWLAVVSFHSLEDREVKEFLRRRSDEAGRGSRHLPEVARRAPSFRLAGKKAIKPGDTELRANPRARSARLRAAQRTEAPAWPADAEGTA